MFNTNKYNLHLLKKMSNLGVFNHKISRVYIFKRRRVIGYCSDSNEEIGKEEKWSLSMTIS